MVRAPTRAHAHAHSGFKHDCTHPVWVLDGLQRPQLAQACRRRGAWRAGPRLCMRKGTDGGKGLESRGPPSSHSGLREELQPRLSEQSPTRKQGCRSQMQSLGSMLKAKGTPGGSRGQKRDATV